MTSSTPTVVLVSGANQGIGFEIIKLLSASKTPYHVFLGSRGRENGIAAVSSLGNPANITHVPLDVTDDESIASCIKTVKRRYGRLDILINNAATSERVMDAQMPTRARYAAVFDVNLFGVAALTEEAAPLLEASSLPRIIMVSSAVGSITLMLAGALPVQLPAYATSKAALNQLMAIFKAKYPRWKINAATPPYSSTNLTDDFAGKGAHPRVGATSIVQLCEAIGVKDGPSGKFFDGRGEVPW